MLFNFSHQDKFTDIILQVKRKMSEIDFEIRGAKVL